MGILGLPFFDQLRLFQDQTPLMEKITGADTLGCQPLQCGELGAREAASISSNCC
jgi:hypothetical protein